MITIVFVVETSAKIGNHFTIVIGDIWMEPHRVGGRLSRLITDGLFFLFKGFEAIKKGRARFSRGDGLNNIIYLGIKSFQADMCSGLSCRLFRQ